VVKHYDTEGHSPGCKCEGCQYYEGVRRRNRGGGGRGRVVNAVVSTAFVVHGAATNLPQSGPTPLRDEARVIAQAERDERARAMRGATQDKGARTCGSTSEG